MEREDFIGMNFDEDISDEDFNQIVEIYEQIKDKISKEEFISHFNENKAENEEFDFIDDIACAQTILNTLAGESNEVLDEVSGSILKIDDVEVGNEHFDVVARVMSISNSRAFVSGKGREGKLCNLEVADNTGHVRVVLWTANIKHVKYISEGDIVKISDIECREGYQGGKEFTLNPRSSIKRLEEGSSGYPNDVDFYPEYYEEFTPIAEIRPNVKANIRGRLIRFPTPHKFSSNGRDGRVVSLEIQDESGKISYTIWNPVPDDLPIEVGDIVKVINEEPRERNGEISFNSFNGRIVKDDSGYEVPQFEDRIYKIQEAIDDEVQDVTLFGKVMKAPSPNEFVRKDNSKGFVRSVELADETASIRVTLWNNDAKSNINKDDFAKISGGNVEIDDFSPSGYRVNTGFNSEIEINPDGYDDLKSKINDVVDNKEMGFIRIATAQKEEKNGVNLFAMVTKAPNVSEFTRRDGEKGYVRSVEISDATGSIRVTLWGDDAKAKIEKGDILKIMDANVEEDTYSGGFRVNTNRDTELEINPEGHEKESDELRNEIDLSGSSIQKIADATDELLSSVTLLGIVTKSPKVNEFTRRDGEKGYVRSVDLTDETGSIRITLWGDDAKAKIEKGDILKVIDGSLEEDEYSPSGFRVNTGRDCELELNPDVDEDYIQTLEAEAKSLEKPILKIEDISDEEMDVTLLGIVTKVSDAIEFSRNGNDKDKGLVKSINLADGTGSIRVTLWGDDTKLNIGKGTILRLVGVNIREDDYAEDLGYSANTNFNTEFVFGTDGIESDLLSTLTSIESQLGPIDIGDLDDFDDDGEEVDIIARLITLSSPREFDRDDGTKGHVCSGDFADGTGIVRVSLWNEKSEYPFDIGKAYKIENARIKLGMVAVELNVGSSARIFEADEEEDAALPDYEELENSLYELKAIDELDEEDRNFKVVGRILSLGELREFQRDDGSKGLVRSLEIGDETGMISVSLWDDVARTPCDVGDPVKIQNPALRFNNNQIQLSVGGASNILDPNPDEMENIPSFEELENRLYQSKEVAELEEYDMNIRVKGEFKDIYGGKLLTPKCPFCNNTLEDEEEEECSYCGNAIEEPNYLLMLPGKIADDSGDISITFFNNLAEELLEMKTDEMVSIYETDGDLGALEGKVENLEGLTLDVLADVRFNEYNEELRLSPKRIFSKEL